MGKSENKRRGRPASLARQLARDYVSSPDASAPARLTLDADVACMTDDPVSLNHLIGDHQFENDLLRGIIDHGGGTSSILEEY